MYFIKIVKYSFAVLTLCFSSFSFAQLLPFVVSNASSNLADKSKAGDGNTASVWNSNGGAPAWITLDFQTPKTVARVRMLTAQYPAGSTIHNVYGVTENNQYLTLGKSNKYTGDGQWLEVDNLNFQDTEFRYVVIQTTQSSSWVAWREFQVYYGGEIMRSCSRSDKPTIGTWIMSSSVYNSDCVSGGVRFNPDPAEGSYMTFRNVSSMPSGMIVKMCDSINNIYWDFYDSEHMTSECYGSQAYGNGMPLDNVRWYRRK